MALSWRTDPAAARQKRNKELVKHREDSGLFYLRTAHQPVRFVHSGVLLLVSEQRNTRDEIVLKAPAVLSSSSTAQRALVQLVNGMVRWGLTLTPGVKPPVSIRIKSRRSSDHDTPYLFEVILEQRHPGGKTVCCVNSTCSEDEHPPADSVNRTDVARATFQFSEGSFQKNPVSLGELGELVWLEHLRDVTGALAPVAIRRLKELEHKKLLALATAPRP